MSEPVGRHAPTVIGEELGEDVSLFDSASGKAVALNGTARDIWALVDGRASVDDVVATLAKAYRVDPEDIEGDVRAALERLVSEGFIVPAAP
jgi:Coenzyme PQQ synthesis protein D (PqqD)